MILKTFKLQLSALRSEHVGPWTCDGSRPAFPESKKDGSGQPSDHQKDMHPFPFSDTGQP